MNHRKSYKIGSFLILFFLSLNIFAAGGLNLGIKYGYAYFDDDNLDRGTTYAGLLSVPLNNNLDVQIEYGKFEDDDGLIKDGKYLGAYVGILFNRFPIRAKVGFIKEEREFDQGKIEFSNITGEFKDVDESDFSFGIGTGLRTPYFTGYLEYLQISDEVYTIAALFNF